MAPSTLGRRDMLGAMLAFAAGCSRRDRGSDGSRAAVPARDVPASAMVATGANVESTRLLDWSFPGELGERAAVVVPSGPPGRRYPVVVALHGRGEALKGAAEGSLGWPRDYLLRRAYERVARPPLVAADFEGFVEPDRLDATNRALAARPFGGLVIVCPYLPDLDLTSDSAMSRYARFVIDVLLPRVRAETPALAAPESTGIDGVSLGGATALHVGLHAPDVFGAVGALQPAIAEGQAPSWVEIAKAARARRPGLALRLATSHDDGFRGAILRTSEALRAASVPHDFADLPGPHDYVWNRGPGSIELLTWHDRVLARAAAPDE